jgi:hypothetical protein
MSLTRAAGSAIFALLLGVLSEGRMTAAPANDAKPAEAKHWAFVPVQRPGVPAVRDRDWVRNPIDAFVLAQLEKKRIAPALPADRRTLLRRVYLDLIGLPPTPREIERFVRDTSPDAYERVVDDLLARPQYGERWARHWLDAVRYAESNGYERDGAKPSAWRYRDYVIKAFNSDKPYDRFAVEQVAGDEIPDTNAETQIATTFLRLGTWDDEPAEPLMDRYDQLDDVLGTTATTFLGVTLRCARCHDHKFEPFTQKDYYRILAVFEPLKRPQQDRKDLDVPVGSAEELAAYRAIQAKSSAALATLPKKIRALKERIRVRVVSENRRPTDIPPNVIQAFRTEPAQRTKLQKQLVETCSTRLDNFLASAANPKEKAQLKQWEDQLAAALAAIVIPKQVPRAYIWSEIGPTAPQSHILARGDPAKPLSAVEPGLPDVLVQQQPEAPKPLAKTTGRRLWLARWLARPDNPLSARVMVNRIWQHHFGRGLVASANDFGVMGEACSHPELLDWLAAEFMAGGWRMKRLHRLIVLSSTYRVSGTDNPAARAADPEVQLLWRWRQRRLEAEAVRDSILAVSGQLSSQMSGPSVYPPIPRAVLEGQSRPGDGWGKSDERQASRRSVYIFVKRVLAVPELEVLDAPDTTSSCEQRPVSTTAPQALTFLNGEFIYQQAGYFADRLAREAGSEPSAQVRRAFELALGRVPQPREAEMAVSFLAMQKKQIELDAARGRKPVARDAQRLALRGFCLVLLNTNEFVYSN